MAKRYELTDRLWAVLCELVPGKVGDRCRTAADNKAFVDGVWWGLRSGALVGCHALAMCIAYINYDGILP